MTKQVFISYSSNDTHTAEKVCTLLEAEGISSWIAPRDVLPGSIYAEEIIKAIENTAGLVLICSRHTSDSVHVRSEVEHAFSQKKVVFPVRMDEVELGKALKYFLGSSHWLIAWNAPIEDCVKRLAESIKKVIGREEIPIKPLVDHEMDDTGQYGQPADVKDPTPGRGAESCRPPHNLPARTTRFIGREKEVAAAMHLLNHENVRLVTLTGPGGTGKTRLGLQVATELTDEFDDGVCFVDLSMLSDQTEVVPAILRTLNRREPQGDKRSPLERLIDCLSSKSMLLILDNFEQVVDAAGDVAAMLATCGNIKIMATSRESLRILGEREYLVPPLRLPDAHEHPKMEMLAQNEAIQLFVDRAESVKADFKITEDNAVAIAEICIRVDGLPLAIELAASRIKYLPATQLMGRLIESLALLKGGARDLPPRQRTLRSTVAWSYDLLSEEERMLLRALSVFSGSFNLGAIETVFESQKIDVFESLASLVDKSMLRKEEGDELARFRMLETIKAFGLNMLAESGFEDETRQKHAQHYLGVAEQVEPELRKANQVAWLGQLVMEHENLTSALRWYQKNGNGNDGLRMVNALAWYWHKRGLYSEGWRWCESFLDMPGNRVDESIRIKTLFSSSWVLFGASGDMNGVRKLLEECVALAQKAGDTDYLASALSWLGMNERMCSRFARGNERAFLKHTGSNHSQDGVALIDDTTDPWIYAITLYCAFEKELFPNATDQRKIIVDLYEVLEKSKQYGDIWLSAVIQQEIGSEIETGERAIRHLTEAKETFQQIGDVFLSYGCSHNLGLLYGQSGSFVDAVHHLKIALRGAVEIGMGIQVSIAGLASVYERKGDMWKFARLTGAVGERRDIGLFTMTKDIDWLPKAEERIKSDPELLAEWEKGKAMSLDGATAYALEIEA